MPDEPSIERRHIKTLTEKMAVFGSLLSSAVHIQTIILIGLLFIIGGLLFIIQNMATGVQTDSTKMVIGKLLDQQFFLLGSLVTLVTQLVSAFVSKIRGTDED